ncbi:hypothetical protein CGRA01v4_10806 [Colletotrichum graminicola]|nr:hypothetical protein CGRA01v4_10806 [Colletotrichum graminicola]
MVVYHQHPSLQRQLPRSRHNLGSRCLVKRQDSLPSSYRTRYPSAPKLQPPPPLGSPLAWFTPPRAPVPTLEEQPPDLCQFTCQVFDASETPASTRNTLLGREVCCCVSDTRTLDHDIAILGALLVLLRSSPPSLVRLAGLNFPKPPFRGFRQ